MKTWSIRARLTAWHAAVTAATIIVLGTVVFLSLSRALLERVDAVLSFEYRETVERLEKLGADDDLGTVPAAFLDEFLLRVTDRKGRIRMESPALHGVDWQPPDGHAPDAEPSYATMPVGAMGEQRMVYGRASGTHAGWTVQIAASLSDFHRQMAELQRILLTLFPISLVIASIAGYALAARAIAPIARITQSAQRISGTNLTERIETDRPDDELGRLAETLNAMVDRLAESLEATRRFTADASHELMTPLAQIRIEAEVALQAPRSATEYADVLRSIIDEVERLSRLARQLLTLAKEDAKAVEPSLEDCSPGDVIRAAVTAAEPSAVQAGVQIALGTFPDITLSIDADRLRHVLDNLLQNAIRYNRPGGRVEIAMNATERHVTISVSDTGTGIPAEALPHVFDRFYRVEKARSRRAGGTGLGLSIARTLIESMHGRIEVESVEGQGSTFRVVLPR